jgi:amino acid transporter
VHLWPAAKEGGPRTAVIAGLTATLTAVNLVGVRRAALVGDVFTIAKLVPLVAFVAIGLWHVEPARFEFGALPETASWSRRRCCWCSRSPASSRR